MPHWTMTPPDYVFPTTSTPCWVWSFAGWGRNTHANIASVVLRLDYVKLTASGDFERVNNFRPGWSSGNCTKYIPIFLNLTVSDNDIGNWVPGINHASYDAVNDLWKNYIYRFLKGMMNAAPSTVYLPLPQI